MSQREQMEIELKRQVIAEQAEEIEQLKLICARQEEKIIELKHHKQVWDEQSILLQHTNDDLNAQLIMSALEVGAKDMRIKELEQALELMIDTHDVGGWPTATIVIARKALEGKQ
jgi:hypothetical protein